MRPSQTVKKAFFKSGVAAKPSPVGSEALNETIACGNRTIKSDGGTAARR